MTDYIVFDSFNIQRGIFQAASVEDLKSQLQTKGLNPRILHIETLPPESELYEAY